VIRDATTADRPVIRALQHCLTDPAPDLFDDLPPGVTLVTTADDDLPVGYLHAFTGSTAHVSELVVSPAHRREGRATALFQHLFVRLRRAGSRAVTLTVAPENAGARRLYDSLGFEEVARLPDHFEHGAALELRRQL
jgi:ribosomal protein S18 acetylase RimI-like enzyme